MHMMHKSHGRDDPVSLTNNARPRLLFPDNNNDDIGSRKLTISGRDSDIFGMRRGWLGRVDAAIIDYGDRE